MRVLVIEDDDSVRSAVRRALLLDGFEVVAAPTGQEGVLKAETVVPDAIILDLGLPDIDGMEVCRRLRSVGNRAPILMLTAREAVEDGVEGLEAGADDYLVKPYDVRELRARLHAIMRRHIEGADGPLSFNVRRDAHHRGITDLEGENGARWTWRRARMELELRLRLLPPAAKTSLA